MMFDPAKTAKRWPRASRWIGCAGFLFALLQFAGAASAQPVPQSSIVPAGFRADTNLSPDLSRVFSPYFAAYDDPKSKNGDDKNGNDKNGDDKNGKGQGDKGGG